MSSIAPPGRHGPGQEYPQWLGAAVAGTERAERSSPYRRRGRSAHPAQDAAVLFPCHSADRCRVRGRTLGRPGRADVPKPLGVSLAGNGTHRCIGTVLTLEWIANPLRDLGRWRLALIGTRNREFRKRFRARVLQTGAEILHRIGYDSCSSAPVWITSAQRPVRPENRCPEEPVP